MRWVACELQELPDAVARGGATNFVYFGFRVALLKLADARNDLVEAQGGLVAEAEVLRDSVETREHLDARHDVPVPVVHMRNGQHSRCQEHSERR